MENTMQEESQTLLPKLLKQEDDLQFDRFTNDMALEIGLRLVEAARAKGKAVLVDICRNGQQLFRHAMEGTTPDNAFWVSRKNKVVQRYEHSSFYMGHLYRARGTSFEAHTGLDPQEYAAHGGAFPLRVRNVGMIGTITVSGLPQAEDHALVVEVLTAYLAS